MSTQEFSVERDDQSSQSSRLRVYDTEDGVYSRIHLHVVGRTRIGQLQDGVDGPVHFLRRHDHGSLLFGVAFDVLQRGIGIDQRPGFIHEKMVQNARIYQRLDIISPRSTGRYYLLENSRQTTHGLFGDEILFPNHSIRSIYAHVDGFSEVAPELHSGVDHLQNDHSSLSRAASVRSLVVFHSMQTGR